MTENNKQNVIKKIGNNNKIWQLSIIIRNYSYSSIKFSITKFLSNNLVFNN